MNIQLHNQPNTLLPFQTMPGTGLVEVYPFEYFRKKPMVVDRRDFDMLLWATCGNGRHVINHTEYEILPGRLFWIGAGQLHQVRQYASEGWVTLISRDADINICNDELLVPPFLSIASEQKEIFRMLFGSLQLELSLIVPRARLIENLLQGMWLCCEQPVQPLKEVYISAELKIFRQFLAILEESYIEHKEVSYYSDRMMLPVRRLNRLTRTVSGMTVYELLQERVLRESKTLLNTTRLSAKEIAFELGFQDPAYFNRFFKKEMKMTPVDFRKRYGNTRAAVSIKII